MTWIVHKENVTFNIVIRIIRRYVSVIVVFTFFLQPSDWDIMPFNPTGSFAITSATWVFCTCCSQVWNNYCKHYKILQTDRKSLAVYASIQNSDDSTSTRQLHFLDANKISKSWQGWKKESGRLVHFWTLGKLKNPLVPKRLNTSKRDAIKNVDKSRIYKLPIVGNKLLRGKDKYSEMYLQSKWKIFETVR